jgi:hypothetical protein
LCMSEVHLEAVVASTSHEGSSDPKRTFNNEAPDGPSPRSLGRAL